MMANNAQILPPLSNRGGRVPETESVPDEKVQVYGRYSKFVIDGKGNLKEIPLRRGAGNTAFIDTLSFTFHESALHEYEDYFKGLPNCFANRDFAVRWSVLANHIFGFGITSEYPVGKGRFYDERWEMSVDGVLYGQFYIGGQSDTILIELTGRGCEVAKDGWEVRLHHFLKQAYRGKITRIDIAKDYFENEITPDSAYAAWEAGEFNKRGKQPVADRYGCDWTCGTNNGKTFYVGTKNSAVMARIYDKAKEQGDKQADWTRFELQYNGRNCVIDLDVLLCPGSFWGGAFPICERLQELGEKTRIMASNKRLEMSIEHCKEVAANQVGRAVNLMLAQNMTAEEIVEFLRDKQDRVPQRVNSAAYSLDFSYLKFIHETYENEIEVVFPDEYGFVLGDLDDD